MSKFFDIINNSGLRNDTVYSNYEPIREFRKIYPNGLVGCSIITVEDKQSSPGEVGVAIIRMFVENGKQAKQDQKYVVGVRFRNFGDMAIIDVISLDLAYHRDIATRHLENLGWPTLNSVESKNKFEDSYSIPFMFVGGHLCVNDENKIAFSENNSDYGRNIFFSDISSIASYAAMTCEIDLQKEPDKNGEGEKFVKEILEFMLNNKLKKGFYELLSVNELEKLRMSGKKTNDFFTGQNLSGLMMMKATDRQITEGGDITKILTNEISEGFAKHMLIARAADMIKRKNEE